MRTAPLSPPRDRRPTPVETARAVKSLSDCTLSTSLDAFTLANDRLQPRVEALHSLPADGHLIKHAHARGGFHHSAIKLDLLHEYDTASRDLIKASNDTARVRFSLAPDARPGETHVFAEHMLVIIAHALGRLAGQRDEADTFVAMRSRLHLDPFRGHEHFQAAKVEEAASRGRSVQFELHMRYLAHAVRDAQALLSQRVDLCRRLIQSGLPGHAQHQNSAYAAAEAYLRGLARVVTQLDAARLPPRELAKTRRLFLEHHATDLHTRAERAADALLAEEQLLLDHLHRPTYTELTARPKSNGGRTRTTLHAGETLQAGRLPPATSTGDAHQRRFWQRYGELAASPHADCAAWTRLLDDVIENAILVDGMRHELNRHIARTHTQELEAARTPGANALAAVTTHDEAVLFVQWYAAYLDEAQRAALFKDASRALTDAVEHGLALDLGETRSAYFYKSGIGRHEHFDAALIGAQRISVEGLTLAPLADGSGVAIAHLAGEDEPAPGAGLAAGYVTSITEAARIVQDAALGFGKSGDALVASMQWLLHRLTSLEAQGTSIKQILAGNA